MAVALWVSLDEENSPAVEVEASWECVFFASDSIEAGEAVDGRYECRDWPADFVLPSQAYTGSMEAQILHDLGSAVARNGVARGDMLLRDQFEADEVTYDASEVAHQLRPGLRAVTLPISLPTVLRFIRPGDRIDVLISRSGSKNNTFEAEILLENVGVIAVNGTFYSSDATALQDDLLPASITLGLTRDEAKLVIAASQSLSLTYVLRSSEDASEHRGANVDLLRELSRQRARDRIEVYRGGRRS